MAPNRNRTTTQMAAFREAGVSLMADHARRKPRPFFLAQAGGALKELLRPKNLLDRARAVLAGCHVRPLVRRQRFGQVFDTHGIGLLRRCLLDRATEPSTFLFTSLQQV